jgi:hypothetical protein
MLALLAFVTLITAIFSFRLKGQKEDSYKADTAVHAFCIVGPVIGMMVPSLANLVFFIVMIYQVADISRNFVLSFLATHRMKAVELTW